MKDLPNTNEKDLMKLLTEKQSLLQDFRFGIAGSKVRNVKEGKALRKDIARLKTEISRRKREVNAAQ